MKQIRRRLVFFLKWKKTLAPARKLSGYHRIRPNNPATSLPGFAGPKKVALLLNCSSFIFLQTSVVCPVLAGKREHGNRELPDDKHEVQVNLYDDVIMSSCRRRMTLFPTHASKPSSLAGLPMEA